MELIILRRPRPKPRSSKRAVSVSKDPMPWRIEVVDVSGADARSLARDPNVAAYAPPVPMRLIHPAARSEGRPQDQSKVSWGVDAVGALRTDLTGEGVVIGIIDTGVDVAHNAFRGIEFESRNFTNEADDDLEGHGTHCLGTIVGRDVNEMRIGVARGVARVLSAKVVDRDGASSRDVAQAISWAHGRGARIISVSLGIDFVGHRNDLKRKLPEDAATSQALTDYGANLRLFDHVAALAGSSVDGNSSLVVVATGNDSKRPRYAIAAGPPATAEAFVSVAAVGRGSDAATLRVADFSNSSGTLCAPGVDICSAGLTRNGTAPNALETMSGTSMAAPHVAGVAALWAQWLDSKGKLARASDIKRNLESKAIELAAPAEDVGLGLVQVPLE